MIIEIIFGLALLFLFSMVVYAFFDSVRRSSQHDGIFTDSSKIEKELEDELKQE